MGAMPTRAKNNVASKEASSARVGMLNAPRHLAHFEHAHVADDDPSRMTTPAAT
jgi:hypothetical protein